MQLVLEASVSAAVRPIGHSRGRGQLAEGHCNKYFGGQARKAMDGQRSPINILGASVQLFNPIRGLMARLPDRVRPER